MRILDQDVEAETESQSRVEQADRDDQAVHQKEHGREPRVPRTGRGGDQDNHRYQEDQDGAQRDQVQQDEFPRLVRKGPEEILHIRPSPGADAEIHFNAAGGKQGRKKGHAQPADEQQDHAYGGDQGIAPAGGRRINEQACPGKRQVPSQQQVKRNLSDHIDHEADSVRNQERRGHDGVIPQKRPPGRLF